jgi:tetratricopeptide (TPR) repeat protein
MKNTEIIDDYLQSRLTTEELQDFEKKLVDSPSFEEEFRELKEIQLGVKTSARKDVKSFLMDIEEDIQHRESTQTKYNMKKMLSVAASVVLLATISFFALRQNQTPSLEQLYSDNFTSYQNLKGQVRGIDGQPNQLEEMAFGAYDMGDYKSAAIQFEQLIKQDESAINYFYMGLANLEAGYTEKAIDDLNHTLTNFTEFQSQAKWYLGLAHMANGNEEDAIVNMVSLTLENSAYKEKAEAVLKEMGLSTASFDNGSAEDVNTRPRDSNPGEIENFHGKRKWQFGVAISYTNGYKYRFISEGVIPGLVPGADVEMIVLRKNKRRKTGFAYILGVN